jgi:flagellar hook-basal body complex protein FliE
MKMSINGIDLALQGLRPMQRPAVSAPLQEVTAQRGGFGQMFNDAIKEVDRLQAEANNQIEGLTLNKSGVTPHSAMIALEKADVAFQLMSQVKSKIIQAYQEVMRTQV